MAARATKRNEVSPAIAKLYTAAMVADDRFSSALRAKYGARAGDMRYQTAKLPPDIKKLAHAHQDAAQRYLDATQEGRKNSALSSAKEKAKLVLTMVTPGASLAKTKNAAMTQDQARSLAADAGDRSMQAGGRTKWSAVDYAVATKELQRLFKSQGWKLGGLPVKNPKQFWIQSAIKRPGALTKKAKAAGKSVQAFAKQKQHAPGRTGKQARLALTLGSLRKNPPIMSVTQGARRADIYPHKGGQFVAIIAGQPPAGPFDTVESAAKAGRLRLAETKNPFKTLGRAASKLFDKLRGKKNPQSVVEDRYMMFHGLPSTQILEFREKVHQHEWLFAVGTLISLDVTGMNGNKMTLAAPDPDKVNFDQVVMLSLSEDGKQIYFRGGDQSMPLDTVLKAFGMNEDDVRDNMKIGQITKIIYRTFKSFEAGGREPINFWHPTGQEHAKGVLPELIYHPLDPSMEVVGGRIKVAPKSLGLGASPGIVG